MKDYINVIYNKEIRPISSYPKKFVSYNIKRFKIYSKKILEIGSGRGDFINEFSRAGMDCFATDVSDSAKFYLDKNVKFSLNNILNEKLPYQDNCFDVIYSKSLIEHFQDPEIFFQEAYRVLKKDGLLITYTPDWETQYLNFYDDATHLRPFSKISLLNSHKLFGFKDCYVEKFYQLPIVWKFPYLKYLCNFVALFVPIRSKIKFLRFSKELMLLSVAKKD